MTIGRPVKSHWSLNLHPRPITGLRTIFFCRHCFIADPLRSPKPLSHSLPAGIAPHSTLPPFCSSTSGLVLACLQYLFTPSSQARQAVSVQLQCFLTQNGPGRYMGGDHKHPIASVMQSLAFKAFSAGYFGNGIHSNWISARIRAGFVGPVLHSWYRNNHCVTDPCWGKSGTF